MSSADWINLSNCLELNGDQRYLFMVLPHIAETNGCFEHNPKMICSLTHCKMTDLEQLFRIMVEMSLLIAYKANGNEYWYLTKFLDMQRLRQKSKIPCPPWLYFEPESGCQDMSKGKYKVNNEKLLQYTNSLLLDNNPPPEQSRGERSGGEINNTEIAIAFNNDEKQRLELALNEVLDGSNGIRSSLNVNKSVQKQQILLALKCNPKHKLNDVWQRFDIISEGDDWKVYERWQNERTNTKGM